MPERIEDEPIIQRIRLFSSRQRNEQRRDVSFEDQLNSLAASIRNSLAEEIVGNSGRTAMYFEAVREIAQYIERARPSQHAEAIQSFLEVASYTAIFGMQWHVLSRSDA